MAVGHYAKAPVRLGLTWLLAGLAKAPVRLGLTWLLAYGFVRLLFRLLAVVGTVSRGLRPPARAAARSVFCEKADCPHRRYFAKLIFGVSFEYVVGG